MRYTPETWNQPGSFETESLAYDDLNEDEQAGAKGLGISHAMWDCHINHYHKYWWENLQEHNLDQYFIALGWNANMWDGGEWSDTYYNKYWDEMTQEQQGAAAQVCYTQELWDEIPLPDWTIEQQSNSTSVPDTSLSTGSCRVTNIGSCVDVLDDVCVEGTLPPVKVFVLAGQVRRSIAADALYTINRCHIFRSYLLTGCYFSHPWIFANATNNHEV